MAIAEATIDFILGNIGCYTLFSTHYTPITRDFLSNEEVKCAKMSYKLI
jgi:DNA mismatch repair ATPase MutS